MQNVTLPKGEYGLEFLDRKRGMFVRLTNPDLDEVPTVMVVPAEGLSEWLSNVLGCVTLEITHHWEFTNWVVTKEGFTYWGPLATEKRHRKTTGRLEVYGQVPPLALED